MEARPSPKKLARSSHRKSRKGCLECKRRRVKCDESKPECLNCTRRSLACNYATTLAAAASSSTASTSPSPTQVIPFTESPDLEHLQLWHHWLTAVSSTFSEDAAALVMWRDNIPKIAFKHQYVAQLILALSALHLARTEESESASYIAISTSLQSSAMSRMMSALSDEPSPSRSSALYVAAMLLCFCSLGKGPNSGQYLLYSDDGVPSWMNLLQGVKSILTQHSHLISGITVEGVTEPGELVNPEELFPGYSKAVDDLAKHISVLRAEDESFNKYTRPLEEIRNSFETAFELQNERKKIQSHLIFAWMYRIGEDFQVALQERKPLALVILAHYVVLLKRLEEFWFVQGWARHIMEAVERDIHPAYTRWLEWPASHL